MPDPLGSVFVEILGDADPFSETFGASIAEAGQAAEDELGASMDAATEGLVDDLAAAGVEGGEELTGGLTGGLEGLDDDFGEAGTAAGDALGEALGEAADVGLTAMTDDATAAAGVAADEVEAAFDGVDLHVDVEGVDFDPIAAAAEVAAGEAVDVAESAASDITAAFEGVSVDVDTSDVSFAGVTEAAEGAASDTADAFAGVGEAISEEVAGAVDEAEGAFERMTDSLGSVQGSIGTMIGGAGLEGFARSTADSTAALGRMAGRLGESDDTIRDAIGGMTDWTFSSNDAAVGMELLSQRGIDNLDTMTDLLPVWDDYADATGQDFPKAVELGSRALGAFNIPAEDAEEHVDTLTYLTNELGVPLDRIGRQFRNSGDELEGLGLGLDETTGLLAAMQANGMDSRDALNVLGKAVDGAEGDMGALLDVTGLTAAEFEEYTGKVVDAEGITSEQADIANDTATPMERLAGFTENLAFKFGDMGQTAGMLAAPLGSLGPAMLALNQGSAVLGKAMPALGGALRGVTGAFRALGTAILANPLFLIVALIIGIIAVIWYFRDEIMAALGAAWSWLSDTAGRVWSWLVDTVGGAVTGVIEWIMGLHTRVREWFGRMISAVVEAVVGWVTSIVEWASTLYTRVTDWVGDLRDAVMLFFARMALRALATVVGWVRDLVAAARDMRQRVVEWVRDLVTSVLGWFRDLARDAVARVRDLVGDVVGWFRDLPGRIVSALSGIGRTLWDAGKDLIQGLLDGAGSLLSSIGQFFLDRLPKWIRGPFERALGISSPSTVFAGYGEDVLDGFQQGLESTTPTVPLPEVDTDALAASADLDLSAGRVTIDGDDAAVTAAAAFDASTRSDEDLGAKIDELIRAVRDGQVVEVDGERLARVTTRAQQRRSSRSLRVTPT